MTLDDLIELEQIKRLKYRYLRCLDQKLFDEIEQCFAPEATASYGGGAYTFEGRDAIMEFLRGAMATTSMLTSHRCHHPEIDFVSAAEATGIWALEDVVVLTDMEITIRGAAFYEDRYAKRDGMWQITHTGYRRTYEELVPRGSISGLTLTADWWATEGRSKLG